MAGATTAITVLVVGFVFLGWELFRERQVKVRTDAFRWFATSTEEEVQETPEPDAEYEVPDVSAFVEPIKSTSTMTLIRPHAERFRRKSQDPLLAEDERGVRVPVLMYHHIRPMMKDMDVRHRMFTVSPEAFEAQMIGLVRAGFRTVTPDELMAAMRGRVALPEKPILISFDDSFRDQFVYAYPVLRRLGLTATFFVVTQSYRQGGAMTQDMIRELDRSGVGFIASHTQHHVYLPGYRKERRVREIVESKKDLEELLGHPVTAFAYPYGGLNDEVEQEVKDAGYALAFGVRLGSLHSVSHAFRLHRMSVFEREDVAVLAEAFSK